MSIKKNGRRRKEKKNAHVSKQLLFNAKYSE